MNARQIACLKILEELVPEIEEEWRNVYHNGSYSAFWPEVDDDEWEHFYNSLYHYIEQEIEYIQDWIKDEYGYDWNIYQDGSRGATFYPDGYSYHGVRGRGYSTTIDVDKVVNVEAIAYSIEDDDDATDASDGLKEAERFLGALRPLNKAVRGSAEYIDDWWKEERAYLVDIGVIVEEEEEDGDTEAELIQECG